MTAYYNEFDPHAAQWLRNLIAAGVIAPGDVDERSIEDVTPNDLRGYTQCHFFAGIGGWAYALDLAGWPRDRPVWTGSCPCQPFSAAGAGAGFADPRHLWPSFAWLIKQCAPPVVFGEQVASKAVEPWVDLVHTDMEALGYAFGAVPFPSAGVGAPHIRDRLFWVADGKSNGRGEGEPITGWMRGGDVAQRSPRRSPEHGPVESIGMGHTDSESTWGNAGAAHTTEAEHGAQRSNGDGPWDAGKLLSRGEPPTGPVNGLWADADWIGCRDGKWRPVEPGTFPLANGVSGRVGLLRGYGNAIVPQAAAEFISAYAEAVGIRSESALDLFAA